MFCSFGQVSVRSSASCMLKFGMVAAVLSLRHGHDGQGLPGVLSSVWDILFMLQLSAAATIFPD